VSRRGIYLRRALIASLLLGTVLLFAGCSNIVAGGQNTLAPEGSVAGRQRDLFLLVVWPAAAVFILVEGLIVFIIWKFHRRKGDDSLPRQVHGNPALEIAWTIAPAILLAIIAVPTLAGVVALGRNPKASDTHVQVTGIQWLWQFAYPDYKDASGNAVAAPNNELHIPAGEEVGFALHSDDVIHSFWIPKLAGKTDVIPNRNNHMWIKADHPGDYSAQCAEFCGFGHAGMRFRVIVQTQADFVSFLKAQGAVSGPLLGNAPATTPTASGSAATPAGTATAANNVTPASAVQTGTPAVAQTAISSAATVPSSGATPTPGTAPAATPGTGTTPTGLHPVGSH
jgi:cytochrome c oxidase subunit 2